MNHNTKTSSPATTNLPGFKFASVTAQLAPYLDKGQPDEVHQLDVRRIEQAQQLDDAHIGEYIADKYLAGRFLYTGGLGWMKYDSRRWERTEEITVFDEVRRAVIDLQTREANAGAGPDRLKSIAALFSVSRIDKILKVAKGCLKVEASQFDNDPDLLNVGNGVVNLKTGELLNHDPGLMLTKITMVDYKADAVHRDWDMALDAVPEDARKWLQTRMGQGITGHPVSDDRLVILRGGGSNGKTTILDAVRQALGDHAVTMPDRILLARPGDHPTELMTLRGARLAFMEEFPELGHLNVKMLKMLLGTDEMSARYVHKDTVFWKATHTPFVTSNYLPRVDESDDGTWRRLVMLNFPYRYRKETKQAKGFDRPGEPELRERLRRGDGQEAVLAWLVEGAKQWYRRGMLTDPGSVRETTAQWRGTTDQILRYLEERMIFDPESYVMSTDLHQDLNHWLQANGHQPWGVHTFTGRFSEHHQVSDHGVVKVDRVRSSRDGLSRPRGAAGRPPGQFAAWVGLRYRNYLDEETTDELGK